MFGFLKITPKTTLMSLSLSLFLLSACADHSFSELKGNTSDAQSSEDNDSNSEEPTPPTPEEPPPVVVVPKVGPTLVWIQSPNGTLGTYDPVNAVYQVIPGSSPLKNIVCLIDKKPTACKLHGDTLVLTSTVPGEHYLSVKVTDENDLSDSDTVSWSLYEKFKKVKTQIVIAKEDAQVDVLFVVDNSKSMADEQTNMADRISNFISRVKGLDWRIGIVTTDIMSASKSDGRMLQFPNGAYYLTSALTPEKAREYFGKTIQQGTTGDYREQGIMATYRAIERALSPKEALDQQNKNFFRPAAALAVIVISDENETGTATKNKGSELIKYVNKAWSDSKIFKFHSIIVRPGDTACKAKSVDHFYGDAYAELTKLTGGVLGNICEEDYGNQLTVIGQELQNTQNTYPIDCSPKDLEGDGIPNVKITATTNIAIPSFTLKKDQVVFSEPPKPGSYTVEYFCPAI